jgi:hypothetical protein
VSFLVDHVIRPGKLVREIDCTPFTELLESERAEVPSTIAAVFELVDNAIEERLKNPRKFTRKSPLKIEIFLHDPSQKQEASLFSKTPDAPPTIVVQDNAGGVDAKEFSKFFRFGEPGEGAQQGISAYGRGGKRARLKLGNRHFVISRRDRQFYGYHVIKTGLKPEWKVPLYESIPPTLPKGVTRVAVTDLLLTMTSDWIAELKERLAVTYADISKDERTQIYVNDKILQPKLIDESIEWSGSTHIRPRRMKFSYVVPVIDRGPNRESLLTQQRVKGEVIVGLLTSTTTGGEFGFDIICNGRLLKTCVKEEVGFLPSREGGWGPPTQKVSMVRGIIRLYGPSKAMPWRSNKVEFDDEKMKPLRDVIVERCRFWVEAGKAISKGSAGDITGILGVRFKGKKIRTISGPPNRAYKPPALTGQLQPVRVSFLTSRKMFELAKRLYDLETGREVNDKAKKIFEEEIQGGTPKMRGKLRTPAVIEFKDLVEAGVPSKVRMKLGMAGVDVNSLLRSISEKTENESIDELRQSAVNLTEEEARQLWKTAARITKRQT